jgi:hypothetical protein
MFVSLTLHSDGAVSGDFKMFWDSIAFSVICYIEFLINMDIKQLLCFLFIDISEIYIC